MLAQPEVGGPGQRLGGDATCVGALAGQSLQLLHLARPQLRGGDHRGGDGRHQQQRAPDRRRAIEQVAETDARKPDEVEHEAQAEIQRRQDEEQCEEREQQQPRRIAAGARRRPTRRRG